LTIHLPPETEQLARRVAAHSGKTPENVLREGVEMQAWIAGIAVEETATPASRTLSERARSPGAFPPGRSSIRGRRVKYSSRLGRPEMIVDSLDPCRQADERDFTPPAVQRWF
jgi:hypothetical protein